MSSKKEHSKPNSFNPHEEHSFEEFETTVAEIPEIEDLVTTDNDLDSMLDDLLAENEVEGIEIESEVLEELVTAVIPAIEKPKPVVAKSSQNYQTQTKLTVKTKPSVFQQLKSSLGVKKASDVDAWKEEAVKKEKFEKVEQEKIRQESKQLEEDLKELELQKIEEEILKQQQIHKQQFEVDRIEAAKEEAARIEVERKEARRLKVERFEAERTKAEKIKGQKLEEAYKLAKLEAFKARAEKAKAARIDAARIEDERLAKIEAEKNEKARIAAEKIEAKKAEAARIEAERIAKIEAKKAEAARIEAEKIEAIRLEVQRIELEKLAKIEAERKKLERLKQEKLDKEQLKIKIAEEKKIAIFCGNNQQISKPEDVEFISYDPRKYLLSTLLECNEEVKTTAELLRLRVEGVTIIIDHSLNTIYCNLKSNSDQYVSLCSDPNILDKIEKSKLDYGEIKSHRALVRKKQEYAHSIESFIATTTLLTAKGRLPNGFDLSEKISLKDGIDPSVYQLIPKTNEIIQAINSKPRSLLEISDSENIPQRYLFSFYNVSLNLDLLNVVTESEIKSKDKIENSSEGLLKRLFRQ